MMKTTQMSPARKAIVKLAISQFNLNSFLHGVCCLGSTDLGLADSAKYHYDLAVKNTREAERWAKKLIEKPEYNNLKIIS